ncbi:uncharacterized protein LOC122211269 [Panthera leo]|uniref:uncharacterized protein LOC122211269 n=1 Tax=Panthera leo TaxID=9689 RepID=UPI001C6A86C9|nr:uncharacterized protein LOC122211269 [Panthera leo]
MDRRSAEPHRVAVPTSSRGGEGYKGGGTSAASAIRGYSCAERLGGAVWAGAGASEPSRLQDRQRLLLIERAPCVKAVIIRDVFAGWLADLMEQQQEELATMKALDAGTAFTLAPKTHVGTSIQTFRYFAGWCDKIQVTPLTALKFTDLTLKADMAKGIVNILLGSEQKEDVYKGFYKCTHGPPSASLSCDSLTTLFLVSLSGASLNFTCLSPSSPPPCSPVLPLLPH